MCRTKFHLGQHTATQTQIGAGSIAARRFHGKYRTRQLHIFDVAVFQRHGAGFDVIGRSFDATFPNRQTHAGDVDAASLGAEGVGLADLNFLYRDVSYAFVTLDVDRFGGDAVNRRLVRFDLSRFRTGNRRGRHALLGFDPQVRRLNALANSHRWSSQAAAGELRRRGSENSIAILGASVAQNQSCDRRAVTFLGHSA